MLDNPLHIGHYALLDTPAHDAFEPRDQVSIDRQWDEGRRTARRRDFLFYVVGLGCVFGFVGAFAGPLGDWKAASLPQRLGNVGILFVLGAVMGLRLFTTRRDD